MPATKLAADGSDQQANFPAIQRQNADEIDGKIPLTHPNIPYFQDATSVNQARPTWAGPVVWTCYYTPIVKPTAALPKDHVCGPVT